jgi:hypothetical protein
MPAEIPVDAPVNLKDLSGHTPMMAECVSPIIKTEAIPKATPKATPFEL